MGGGAENRKQARLLIKKEVLINNTIKGYALDISEGGLFLYTHISFPKGRLIEVAFSVEDGGPSINTQARIQVVHQGVGVGVIFTSLPENDAARLRKFISANMNAHPLGAEAAKADVRKKVLIVDDEASVRNVYKNKLALSGFAVREAANGVEAFQAIEKERPDLILLDIMMERMDGIKFLQLLRTNDALKDLKVIVLSGRLPAGDTEKIFAFGVIDVFSKMTTSPNKLVERIKELLG